MSQVRLLVTGIMNATELFHKDGRPAGVWYCEKCRLTFSHREAAELCCKPYVCSLCGKPCEQFHTICESCLSARRIAVEQERFEKAVKLTEWDGWVYVEGLGFQDGFFPDTDELREHCEEGVDLPSYAWTCSSKPLVRVDADDILDDIFTDAQEDLERYRIEGLKEFREAVEAFNEANKILLAYNVNYTQLVLLKPAL
mgnify:CR=1 FL=1